jgi:hypothetical protein
MVVGMRGRVAEQVLIGVVADSDVDAEDTRLVQVRSGINPWDRAAEHAQG